jgi:glycosyltransferase involved in cell wall biosynthesis
VRVYATVATRFTIAIPTHNRRQTVLLAVRSALAQTRQPEQIIVLCDGCDDGTADAVRALASPLTEAVELPKGPGFAYGHRNRSLELARGEVILWLADPRRALVASTGRADAPVGGVSDAGGRASRQRGLRAVNRRL